MWLVLAQVNLACRDYFWQAIQDATEDLQRAYLREWLYHRSVELTDRGGDADLRFRDLLVDLQTIHLKSNAHLSSAHRFSQEVREDRELLSSLEMCTKERSGDLLASFRRLSIQPY